MQTVSIYFFILSGLFWILTIHGLKTGKTFYRRIWWAMQEKKWTFTKKEYPKMFKAQIISYIFAGLLSLAMGILYFLK